MKKGCGSDGVADIHEAGSFYWIREVLRCLQRATRSSEWRQTMFGLYGEMSEICASLACDGVEVVKGRRNDRYLERWRERGTRKLDRIEGCRHGK